MSQPNDALRAQKNWQDWSAADESSSDIESSSSTDDFLVKQEKESFGGGTQENGQPELKSLDSKRDQKSVREYKHVSLM